MTLTLPKDAEVLTVQTQRGHPCIWVLVPEDEPALYIRRFVLFGTGDPFAANGKKYIGTFQLEGGALVFHLFEEMD